MKARRLANAGDDALWLWSKLVVGAADGGSSVRTAAQQGAPPDRKKRHSIRLLTACLVAPLFAAGELSVVPARQLVGKRDAFMNGNLICFLFTAGVLQAHITAILFSFWVASTCSRFILATGVLRRRYLAALSNNWLRRNNALAKVFAIHKIFYLGFRPLRLYSVRREYSRRYFRVPFGVQFRNSVAHYATDTGTTRRCTRPPTASFPSLVPRCGLCASGGG